LPVLQVTTTTESSENLPLSSRTALIALGSNQTHGLLDAKSIVLAAVAALSGAAGVIRAQSDLFSTPAYPEGSGPDFVNATLVLDTRLQPQPLLDLMHGIETEFGRVRDRRWGPRSLDLDLLALGRTVFPDLDTFRYWQQLPLARQQVETPDQLVLPHPRLQERAFVLVPLVQALQRAGLRWKHPVLDTEPAEWLTQLPPSDVEAIRPLEDGRSALEHNTRSV
jgi:2-amino-4-hydroxy-6-hydroxymethyldihydropteridine diphosphokinase